jgi:hypothetical protein
MTSLCRATIWSGFHISVRQHRTCKGSPGLYLALIPPSPRGRGGIECDRIDFMLTDDNGRVL